MADTAAEAIELRGLYKGAEIMFLSMLKTVKPTRRSSNNEWRRLMRMSHAAFERSIAGLSAEELRASFDSFMKGIEAQNKLDRGVLP